MITTGDIYRWLDSWAPFDSCLEFDNAGLLVGGMDSEVRRAAVVLDLTDKTLEGAVNSGCQLVITHHPVIFDRLRAVESNSIVFKAIGSGISVISAHTNLDIADGGVNDALAKKLRLSRVTRLFDGSMARIGDVDSMPCDDFAEYLKGALGCGCVKYVPTAKSISKVVICGGAGADFIRDAVNAGADALVTGEARHHERLECEHLGIAMFECGHFCTESPVKTNLQNGLHKQFPKLEIILPDESDPAKYI